MKIQYQVTHATLLQPSGYRSPDIRNLAEQISAGSLLSVPAGTPMPPYLISHLETSDPVRSRDQLAQPVATSPAPALQPEPITFQHMVASVGAGGTASCVFLNIPGNATHNLLVTTLENFVSPSDAQQYAGLTLAFARTNAGKIVCLFLASSCLAIGILEAVNPSWPLRKKIVVGVICGALLVVAIVIIFLRTSGQTKVEDNKTSPPASSVTP
jgi:hypothetical protein